MVRLFISLHARWVPRAKELLLGVFTASPDVRYFIEPIDLFAELPSAPYSACAGSALSSSFGKPYSSPCSRCGSGVLDSERGVSVFAVASCGKIFAVASGRAVYPL